MDTLDYWQPADALAFRCTPEEVGHLKPGPGAAVPVPQGASDLQRMALAYAPRAMRALARIAEGEGRAAVLAAQAILAYAYPAPAPGMPSPPKDVGALAPPPWLEEDKRLSYAAGVNDRGLN